MFEVNLILGFKDLQTNLQLFANGFQYDFEDSELNWFLMTIEIKCRNGYGLDYEEGEKAGRGWCRRWCPQSQITGLL